MPHDAVRQNYLKFTFTIKHKCLNDVKISIFGKHSQHPTKVAKIQKIGVSFYTDVGLFTTG